MIVAFFFVDILSLIYTVITIYLSGSDLYVASMVVYSVAMVTMKAAALIPANNRIKKISYLTSMIASRICFMIASVFIITIYKKPIIFLAILVVIAEFCMCKFVICDDTSDIIV